MSEQRPTAESDRIPVAQKLAFGFGQATPIAFVNSVNQLTSLIYNIALGVRPGLLAWAQMVPRLWDAISDPLFGYFSDNTRTRWGRRKPYIVIGGLFVALTYVLVWTVPSGLGEYGIFSYYLAMSLLFYTAVTAMSVPLLALGCEMSPDYHERTRLFAYGGFIGNVFAVVTPWIYHLANLKWLFKDEVIGMKAIAVFVAVIIGASALVSGIVCKEPNVSRVRSQVKIELWPSIKATFKNKTYVCLIGFVFCVTAGFNLVNTFANYIVIYYIFGGLTEEGVTEEASYILGINGSAWAIAALIAIFPMAWTSKRIGKAKTVQFSALIMLVGCLLKIVCYNRMYPWLLLIPTVFISTGMLVMYTMAGALIADICDEDELDHGVRREGSYSAVYSWWLKFAASSGILIAGYLLESTGYTSVLMAQHSLTLFWMRAFEIGVPAIFCAVAYFLLANYTLTEDRVYEIKDALEQRHAEEDAAFATDSLEGHTTRE